MGLRKFRCCGPGCRCWCWVVVPHTGPPTRIYCTSHFPRGYNVATIGCDVCGASAYTSNPAVHILCPLHGPRQQEPCALM